MTTTTIMANSIWPNCLKKDDEGYVLFYPLGTNKVDISTVVWPTGDKLISPYVYQNDKLVGFCDTVAMTVSDNTTISLPYTHIEADFSSIEEGKLTVNAPNATVKKFKWSATIDSGNSGDTIVLGTKYLGCETVYDVIAVDPDYLTNDIANGVWSERLDDLEDGCYESLTSEGWEENLGMFDSCFNLRSFYSDLSSLTDGYLMFYGCYNLKSFTANLSNLMYGFFMFQECSNLTTFSSNLSSLTDGDDMFGGCKLDSTSVKIIIDTINTVSSGTLTLGMGCDDNTADKDLFAQEIGYANMTSLLAALQAKGWTVDAQFNGRPTTTYSMRRTIEPTLPVFVKLIEVEESSDKLKSFHTHTSLDGTKKYRISWFHETTGSTEGYTQFVSLEEVIETLNIKPIERN